MDTGAASSSLQCDVDAADVVKVVLQFLKENSLTASLQALQDESQVALITVENLDGLGADVQQGQWRRLLHAAGCDEEVGDRVVVQHIQAYSISRSQEHPTVNQRL